MAAKSGGFVWALGFDAPGWRLRAMAFRDAPPIQLLSEFNSIRTVRKRIWNRIRYFE